MSRLLLVAVGLASAFFYARGSVEIKLHLRGISTFALLGLVSLGVATLCGIVLVAQGSLGHTIKLPADRGQWEATARYIGWLFFAQSCFYGYFALRGAQASEIATLIATIPLWVALLLQKNEPLTTERVIGMILVILGIVLVVRTTGRAP